jgi:nitroreductase
MNVQPWRFVVVREPTLKAQLQVAANNQAQVGGAPAVIVLYSDMPDVIAHADELAYPDLEPEARVKYADRVRTNIGNKPPAELAAWGHAVSYIALGYLLLAAESLGYVTSPMLGFKADAVKALLDLPPHVTIPAIVALGVAAESGHDAHRHDVDRVARFL